MTSSDREAVAEILRKHDKNRDINDEANNRKYTEAAICALIDSAVAEAEIKAKLVAFNEARAIVWGFGYDNDKTALHVRERIWEHMKPLNEQLTDNTNDKEG